MCSRLEHIQKVTCLNFSRGRSPEIPVSGTVERTCPGPQQGRRGPWRPFGSAGRGQDAAMDTPKIRPQATRTAQRTRAGRHWAAPPPTWGPTPHNQHTAVPPESVRCRTPEYKHVSKRAITAVPLGPPKTVSCQKKNMPRAPCPYRVLTVSSGGFSLLGCCRIHQARLMYTSSKVDVYIKG